MDVGLCTRWFKYDRDYLCVNKSQFVPVIFEPPCTFSRLLHRIQYTLHCRVVTHYSNKTNPIFFLFIIITYLQVKLPSTKQRNSKSFTFRKNE